MESFVLVRMHLSHIAQDRLLCLIREQITCLLMANLSLVLCSGVEINSKQFSNGILFSNIRMSYTSVLLNGFFLMNHSKRLSIETASNMLAL